MPDSPSPPHSESPDLTCESESESSLPERLRLVAGDRRVWIRAGLRSALVAIVPCLLGSKGGYVMLLPLVGLILGVVGALTFAEGIAVKSRRRSVSVTGLAFMVLAFLLLGLGSLQAVYVYGVLEEASVAAGAAVISRILNHFLAGRWDYLGPAALWILYLSGAFGIASATQVCSGNWKKERVQALQLLTGHSLAVGIVVLLATDAGQIFVLLPTLVCPLCGTVMVSSILFLSYGGVDRLLQPAQASESPLQRRRRREAQRKSAPPHPPDHPNPSPNDTKAP